MTAGQRIGRFELRRYLGRGAMGEVHLAWDPDRGEEVALKLIRLEGVEEDALEAEKRGVRLQRKASREVPAVAAVYGTGRADGFYFIEMEYIDGADLSAVLKQAEGEPIPVGQAVDIAIQLCEVLDRLHGFTAEIDGRQATRIVHADLKPQNLRLQDDGTIRVVDFGVAKDLSADRPATRNLFGTYPYTPPERLTSGGLVDEKSDLWAVGIILYRMVSGRHPYPGKTEEELAVQLTTRPPTPLPESCPAGLRRVVHRCLAFDPARRYPSALALKTALERFRDSHAELRGTDPPSPTEADAAAASQPGSIAAEPLPPLPALPDDEATTGEIGEPAAFPAGAADRRSATASASATDTPAPASSVDPLAGGRPEEDTQRTARREESGAEAAPPSDSERTRRTGRPRAEGEPAVPPAPGAEPARSLPNRSEPTRSKPSQSEPMLSEPTRRTGRAAAPAAPASPQTSPATASPARSAPVGPRIRLSRFLVLMAVVFVIGSQLYVHTAAQSVLRQVASDARPDVDQAWQRYRRFAWLRPFGVGLGETRERLRQALVVSGDLVLTGYRRDASSVGRSDWSAASEHFGAALRLDPNDPWARAKMLYARAHLDRIEARSLTSQGQSTAAARRWTDAIFGFRQAAEAAPEWPDPYLGLARIYAYDQFDLDKLERALADARRRGHPTGDRERAQLADAYRREGELLAAEARVLELPERRAELLQEARYRLREAISRYDEILGFGRARQNRNDARRTLRAVEDLLDDLEVS